MEHIDTSVLEEEAIIRDAETLDDDEDIENPDLLESLSEGMDLLVKSRTMMEYIADPELCKTITARERKTLMALTAKISQYLIDMDDEYGEEL